MIIGTDCQAAAWAANHFSFRSGGRNSFEHKNKFYSLKEILNFICRAKVFQLPQNQQYLSVFRLLFLATILLSSVLVEGQKNVPTTIILIRHAEKDTGDNNPGLTEAGKLRAKKLITLFPNAQPTEMYATPYKRTFQTLQPWAGVLGLTIKPYSPESLADFANQLLKKKGKTIVVAGHSNTTPALANLLVGSDSYKTLDDNEYNKVFVITVVKGKGKGKVIEY